MSSRLLVYGANGFTGRLIVEEALAFGLNPVIAGRSPEALRSLARSTGLEFRRSALDEPHALQRLLGGVDVVLNAAGPFSRTALPLARMCIELGIHYLDVCGEVPTLEAVAALDGTARARGVMLMPAVGFDVVPSDCMAASVVARLPTATELEIGLAGLKAISRGSAQSVCQVFEGSVAIRRAGRVVRVAPGEFERDFDFGRGPTRAVVVSWGDVVTAFHSTRIPNITVFLEATGFLRLGVALARTASWLFRAPGYRSWLQQSMQLLPAGPDDTYRARQRAVVVVVARDSAGRSAAVRLETPEVYSFTATTAIAIADRVLHGVFKSGFQTPAKVYGPSFVLSLPGVEHTTLS